MKNKTTLEYYYGLAMKEVYGNWVEVSPTQRDKIRNLEVKLIKYHISLWDYSYTVAALWEDWLLERDLRYLPLNIFLGVKALQWYLDFKKNCKLNVNTKEAKLLNIEKDFASQYFTGVFSGVHPLESFESDLVLYYREVSEDWYTNRLPYKLNILKHYATYSPLHRTRLTVTEYRKFIPVLIANIECRNSVFYKPENLEELKNLKTYVK